MAELVTGTEPGPEEWDPWEPETVAELLSGVEAPWCVAGGLSIDLFLGRRTREHADIEIVVPETSMPAFIEALDGREFVACDYHTYVRDPDGMCLLDVMRDPHDGHTWIWRVNHTIRLPYPNLIRQTTSGIPYQCPEVSLLYKAGTMRPKDEADLDATITNLTDSQRAWIREAITNTWGTEHPWLTGDGI